MTELTAQPISDSTPTTEPRFLPHTSHWGVFSARWWDDRLEVRPHPDDPDPNRIIENFPGALRHRARVVAGSNAGLDLMSAGDAMSSFRCPGMRPSTCSAPS